MGYGVRELKNKDFRIVAICCSCILFWGLIGLQGTRSFTMVEQRFTKQFNELFDYVKDLQADKVYVYGSYKAAADIQTRIMESEVICVNDNDIKDIKENEYLVLDEKAAGALDISDFERCYGVLNYTVYQKHSD